MAGLAPELRSSDCLIRFLPIRLSAFFFCPCLTTVHISFYLGPHREQRCHWGSWDLPLPETATSTQGKLSPPRHLPDVGASRSGLLCGLGHSSCSLYICPSGNRVPLIKNAEPQATATITKPNRIKRWRGSNFHQKPLFLYKPFIAEDDYSVHKFLFQLLLQARD